MAGYLNGCAAIITRSYPKALYMYMHCSSHCLNLCIIAMWKIAEVNNNSQPWPSAVADPEGVLRVPGHQPSWHGAAGAREIEVDSARRE